jgi:hypothetical protein
MYVGNISRKN